MAATSLLVAAVDPESADALALIAELSDALARLTGDSGRSSFDANEVRGPGAVFLLARSAEDGAVGCGALRPLNDGRAEIKRMFARPGSGAGALLLAELERQAAAFGYQALCLSTRRINVRAVAFYERHGYLMVAPFGRYAAKPESVCLEKSLSR
jgi:GNAT superfamily N-acetyltransferase